MSPDVASSQWQISEQQLAELNTVLQRADDVLVYNCVTRTAQESKLFPVMPYLMMSFVDTYYLYPDIIRAASQYLTPEEIGHRSRESSTYLSQLTSWACLNYYINGRAWLIRMGIVRPQDNLEDLWTVTDWWLRFKRSYHREGGHVNTLDSWDMQPSHPERTLQVFEADAFRCDDRLRTAVNNFMATATQYSFLVNCESRSGLQASGPYRLGGNRILHLRDFMNLSEGDFSWLDGVAADVPYNNLTLALVTEGTKVEVAEWGTAYTEPAEISGQLLGVGLYTSDFLSDGYIPVGMGSAAELASTLDDLTAACNRAMRSLYSRYADMSFKQMVEAGILTYISAANGISHAAGTYHQAQWNYIDDRVMRFWPIFNEEYSLDAYLDHFALLIGQQGSASEYYLSPVAYRGWRDLDEPAPGPGRNAFTVSQHVLLDHDYSLRANPGGLGACSGASFLPPKSGLWTTTAGRLTEPEMNGLARAADIPACREPWSRIDDAWVKWNWQDPEVDALYRHTQRRSRLLADQGSGLRREDIDRLRVAAGETPWA